MTDSVNAPDPARLDELAAVTREYAKYSRWGVGVSLAALGACWLAAGLCDMAGLGAWAIAGYAIAPAVWLVAGRRMRPFYQRHGRVTDPSEELLGLGKTGVVWAGFASALLVVETVAFGLEGRDWAVSGGVATSAPYATGIAALVFAAWVAPRWAKRTADGVGAFGVATMALPVVLSWHDRDRALVSAVAIFGLALVVAGLIQHRRHRRVERRLAALKART